MSTYPKRTKEETNRLALECKRVGRVSKELWEAVCGVAYSLLDRKWHFEREEHMSLAGQAVCKALEMWDSERGDFPLTVYHWTNHFACIHFHEFHHILRIPMHKTAEDMKTLQTIHPDTAVNPDGSDLDLWDTYDELITYQVCNDPTDVKKALEELPGALQEVYYLKYECELTNCEVGEILGVCESTVKNRVNDLKTGVEIELCKMNKI